MKKLILSFIFLFSCGVLADINWSGNYRIEFNNVDKIDLNNSGKSYFLQHLVLQPKIIAADGVNINARFDILNNASLTYSNQLGEIMGQSPNGSSSTSSDATNTAALSEQQGVGSLQVTHLYLTYIKEFAAFIAGRAPKQFGLGISHNAGTGPFDHWLDTHSVVGMKMLFGNIFLTPMYATVLEDDISDEDDANEYIIHFGYENPETDLNIGIYYESKVAVNGITKPTTSTNSTPFPNSAYAGDWRDYEHQKWNLYYSQVKGKLKTNMEFGFHKADTGVINTDGNEIKWDAFAMATEFYYKWSPTYTVSLHAGYASGDDPETADTFEGFIFDKNYDVAMLMFNHVLGNTSMDLLGSGPSGRNVNLGLDTEAISNVIYLAPGLDMQFSDTWGLSTRLIYASLHQTATGVDSDLGVELDFILKYRPNDRFIFDTGLGYLMPGSAFKNGSNGFDTNSALAITAKAAISF